jgi:hypothetical protein
MAALKPYVVPSKAVSHVPFKGRKIAVGVTPPSVCSGKVVRSSHHSYNDNTVGSRLRETTEIYRQGARLP